MAEDRTRVALIGCGYFGRFHLRSWLDLAPEGVDLIAVCDTDGSAAQEAAQIAGGIAWFTDMAKMLGAARPDLVDIATRMPSHRALVGIAMAARVPTVVQKPLAPTWKDCLAIDRAARESGTFLAVHENFRYQAPVLRIAEILASGEIGTPNWARIAFRTGVDVYANQPYFYDEERLVILDLGIHLLDVSRVLLGEAHAVSAVTQRRNSKVRAEDTATILTRHEGGAVAQIECTYENRRSDRAEMEIEIEGTQGGLTLQSGGVIEVEGSDGTRREIVPCPDLSWAEPPLQYVQASVRETCARIAAALRAGRPAETAIGDNLRTYALVEAAYRAADSGCTETPDM